jgi:putative transposase
VSDNGPCFRGETDKTAFAGEDPLLRHVRTRVRSPQTNGVIETARFRDIYNRIRPHQSPGDRTPRDAYLGITGGAPV